MAASFAQRRPHFEDEKFVTQGETPMVELPRDVAIKILRLVEFVEDAVGHDYWLYKGGVLGPDANRNHICYAAFEVEDWLFRVTPGFRTEVVTQASPPKPRPPNPDIPADLRTCIEKARARYSRDR